jgi:glycine oxidase
MSRVAGYDTIIVGGGIIGSAIAFELARAGQRVLVLDRQQPGLEASWAAAGMLAPGAETPDSVIVAPLGRASLDLYPAFVAAIEQASGRDVAFELHPGLQIFFGDEAGRERDHFIGLQRGLGLPAEAIGVEEARRLEPHLTSQARAAARLEREARVDNRLLMEAVLAAAQARGAELRSAAAVSGLLLREGRCAGVRTPSGEIASRQVVVAAGSFSVQLADAARYAPTRPVRGQMLALRCEEVRVRHVLRSSRGYIVPRADGRLICGSTSENAGYEKRVTPEGLRQIQGAAVELVPALAGAALVETWSGLRPDTPDHLPVLGPTDVPGLFIATGHYRNGILLAPITARILREFILDGKCSVGGVEKYSSMRFAKIA